MKSNKKSVSKIRETEIARRLALVFERLPLQALNSLLQNLCDGVLELLPPLNTLAPTSCRQWQVVLKNDCIGMQIKVPASIAVEVLPMDQQSSERFDLVIPIPPFEIRGHVITSLIFEFKLAKYDQNQLTSYAGLAPNSLMISVAINGESAVSSGLLAAGQYIVLQTWEHLYFALQSMLSGDAQLRISPVQEPGDLLLNFDHRVAGQDRLAFEIESCLQLIIDRNLLPNPNLVLVVPRGIHATATLANKPPYYVHPATWRSGYSWLVVVWRNEIEGIYKVVESATTDLVGGKLPPRPRTLSLADWQLAASVGGKLVSVLHPVGQQSNLHILIGKRYNRTLTGGTAAAFTQTHRYLDQPNDLHNFFK